MGNIIASQTYDTFSTEQGRIYLGTYESVQAALQEYPDAIYEPENDSCIFGMVADGEVLLEDERDDDVVTWDGVTRPMRQRVSVAYRPGDKPHHQRYYFLPEQRQQAIDDMIHGIGGNQVLIWPDGTVEVFDVRED